MQYIYYTRLFEGLQWLWGRANSPGVNDYFGMYTRARQTLQRFADDNKRVTNHFYEIMDEVKKKFTASAQTDGASTGVNTLEAMADMYRSLSELSLEKVVCIMTSLGWRLYLTHQLMILVIKIF